MYEYNRLFFFLLIPRNIVMYKKIVKEFFKLLSSNITFFKALYNIFRCKHLKESA